ncbi:MAG TPA: GNAT family N-acetyltransferase [Nitrosopumilaceae archaeon]|nr:GNAT family N-acetyltransferase [Nitrosopumilaceae archaeon]
MDAVIRFPSKKEVPTILNLLYELGRPRAKEGSNEKFFENLVQKYIEDSDKQILVAEYETKLVGMVSIVFLPRLNQKSNEMYIPELIVTKNYQNVGIGKKLINFCIDLAKKENCHRIRLESGNQRKESHLFYRNLGFSQSALSFSMEID